MSYKNWQEVIGGRAGLIVIGTLILLSPVLTINHLFNLPYLHSEALLERIEWSEIVFDFVVIFSFGLISVVLIRQVESKRRKVEDSLRESEGKYRFLYEQSSTVNMIIGMDGMIKDVNETVIREFSYSKDEIVGKPALEFVVPEQKEKVAAQLEREFKGEDTPEIDVDIYAKDGSIHTILFSPGQISLYEGGQPTSILVTGIDITQRKKAEEALRRSEGDYRGLFEGAHDAIIIFDPEGEIILDANQRASDIYGFDRSEFIGMSLEKITKDISQGKRQIQATLDKGCYHNFETVQYCKDGTGMLSDVNTSMVDYRGKRRY